MATLTKSDLAFIYQQILIAEAHAAGTPLAELVADPFRPLGLRTVDGTFNNLLPGQQFFGAADQLFPRLLDPSFRPGYDTPGSVLELPAAHHLQSDRRPDRQ